MPTRDRAGNVIEETSNMDNVTTLFGISCNRQINSEDLKDRPADVTRSTVHKSVVVIARKPIFGPIREKLAVITRAFFQQADFRDLSLIDNLYDNLNQLFSVKLDENDMYVGMSLRELIFRLRSNVLVLFKALLLEKKIIFHSSNTEVLCASQFSLVSLVPALLEHLEDCTSPLLNKFDQNAKKPTSLRTSDRKSLLTFMGLPLQPFAEGGMFNPYVPLQQFHELKAPETKYFLAGSTNTLLIENYPADIIVRMDNGTVDFSNKNVKNILTLSASDNKWMDFVVQSVVDTWDPEDPWRPKGLGFHGSEDFVRQQFEDYIMGLMSSVKYDSFLARIGNAPPKAMLLREVDGNPMKLFNEKWVNEWRATNNYRIFMRITDNDIFDIVEPRHMVSSLVSPETRQRSVSVLSQASFVSALQPDDKEKTASPPTPVPARVPVKKPWGSFFWRGTSKQLLESPSEELPKSPKSPFASDNTTSSTDEFHDASSEPSSTGRGRANTVSTNHSANFLSPDRSPASSASSSQQSQSSGTTPVAPTTGGMFTGWSLWGAGSRKSGGILTNRLSQLVNPAPAQSTSPNAGFQTANSSLTASPVAERNPFSSADGPGSPISFISARRFGGSTSSPSHNTH